MSFKQFEQELNQHVVGQSQLIRGILVTLLAGGHTLVEGAPGLAKTRLIKGLASHIQASFHRIQFTPDLLPSDITGSEVFQPDKQQFEFQAGPVFANIILADEINRAPAKVQAALLEAMGENQVSVAGRSLPLPQPFFVMATQNPIEQEGTYPLPEAQLDRFMLHLWVDYPTLDNERAILNLLRQEEGSTETNSIYSLQDLAQWQKEIDTVHVSPAIDEYLLRLVDATRHPKQYDDQLAHWIDFGVSPRATIAFDRCCRALALLNERDYVVPEDIQWLAGPILRHRIIRSYNALAENKTNQDIINHLLTVVAVS